MSFNVLNHAQKDIDGNLLPLMIMFLLYDEGGFAVYGHHCSIRIPIADMHKNKADGVFITFSLFYNFAAFLLQTRHTV